MSRTKTRPTGTANPIKKIITFKPNSGVFNVYDKDTKTKEELDDLKLIILDADRFSMTGYSPEYDSGIVSNYVHNTRKEDLVVKVFTGNGMKEIANGKYQDIKEDVEGGNYTKNVLALVDFDGEWVMSDIQLVGSARQKFVDWLYDEDNDHDGVIVLSPSKEVYNYNKKTKKFDVVPKDKQKRWRTTWLRQLMIDTKPISEDLEELAIQEDTKLQKYLSNDTSAPDSPTSSTTDSQDNSDDEDDLPF